FPQAGRLHLAGYAVRPQAPRLRSRHIAMRTGLRPSPYLSAVRLARSCALLNLQGFSKGFAQLLGPADTPVVKKNDPWLFKEHMIVHRNDLQRRFHAVPK